MLSVVGLLWLIVIVIPKFRLSIFLNKDEFPYYNNII